MKRRSNNEGSISYDKSRDSYRAVITTPEGKRIFKRFKTRDEADNWIVLQRSNMLRGAFVAPSDTSLGEYSILWLTAKKPTLSQRTLERYHSLLKHLNPIANLRLQAVTPSTIQSLYAQLADKLSANTIAKVHKLLGAIFKRALFDDLISKNIMLAISPPRFEKKEIEIFSHDEVNKIFKVCTTDKNYSRYWPEILLAATTGMRLGEILGLRWQDVNLFNAELNIRKSLQQTLRTGIVLNPPKTKAGLRKIRITPAAVDLLTELKRSEVVSNIDGLIFHTKKGTPISPRNFERAWGNIVKLSGIAHKNFHVWRHTHATELLADGVPIVEVSRRLGHSKVSLTLDLYGQAIPSYDEKIAQKVANLYIVPAKKA